MIVMQTLRNKRILVTQAGDEKAGAGFVKPIKRRFFPHVDA
jgi:hypothetical protein